MQFEWDPVKAALNEEKHGVSFREAATVFEDSFARVIDDPDHSLIEQREILIGTSKPGRILFTSFTRRRESIRIISSRRAKKKEGRDYEIFKTTNQ